MKKIYYVPTLISSVLSALIFLVPAVTNAQTFYECRVGVRSDNSCDQYRGQVHICQIYDYSTYSYIEDGRIPSFCHETCIPRSEIPKECAMAVVAKSSNPEAHAGYQKEYNNLTEETGLGSEEFLGIRGQVEDQLTGIENEINTDDGVDEKEVQYIVGKITAIIKDIIKERISNTIGSIKEKVGDTVDSATGKIKEIIPDDNNDEIEDTKLEKITSEDELLDEEIDPFVETGLESTKPGEYKIGKYPDENGVNLAKIVDAYGVERYTKDGKHFYDTPYSAAHFDEGVRGAWNGAKDTFSDISDWFFKTKEKDADKQLRLDIAREVLDDIKSQREKDIEKAHDKLADKIDVPTFGDVPAQAVIEVAKELPAKDFASAALVYFAEREKGNSPTTIRENNSEVLSEGYGTFGNQGEVSLSTTNKYATAVLYARYEEAYQRYQLAKELGRIE